MEGVPASVAQLPLLQRFACRSGSSVAAAELAFPRALPRGPWLQPLRWLGLQWRLLMLDGAVEALRCMPRLEFLCSFRRGWADATRDAPARLPACLPACLRVPHLHLPVCLPPPPTRPPTRLPPHPPCLPLCHPTLNQQLRLPQLLGGRRRALGGVLALGARAPAAALPGCARAGRRGPAAAPVPAIGAAVPGKAAKYTAAEHSTFTAPQHLSLNTLASYTLASTP